MPRSAPDHARTASAGSVPAPDESTTAPLSPAVSAASDTLSDATSSMSLIEMPSDDEDEDEEVFVDSRSHFVGTTPEATQRRSPDVEYVVLYDSSDDE